MDNYQNSEDANSVLNSIFSNEHKECSEDGVYYFETDFLPLKGNLDYGKLVKALAILDVQRIKVSQDIEKLYDLKSKVDFNPEDVKNTILGGKPDFLHRLKIYDVPSIDWTKYKTLNINSEQKKKRRLKKREDEKDNIVRIEDDGQIKVRGRLYNEKKPETFNQLWTVEEQLRLEQLLVEFPPEPIENRRWKKIADALGNRTTKQVCSRVQKYFKKLHKAGLSTIAPTPKSLKASQVHKKNKHLLYKPTTFFPGMAMAELGSASEDEIDRVDDFETIKAKWKKIKDEIFKYKLENENRNLKIHYGHKCNFCNIIPISGIRWECFTCTDFNSCSDCLLTVPDTEPASHPLFHNFVPIMDFVNPYYSTKALGTDSYLDPNFSKIDRAA